MYISVGSPATSRGAGLCSFWGLWEVSLFLYAPSVLELARPCGVFSVARDIRQERIGRSMAMFQRDKDRGSRSGEGKGPRRWENRNWKGH